MEHPAGKQNMNCRIISVPEDHLRYLFDYLNYSETIQLILTNTIFTRAFLDSNRKIRRSISMKDDITKIRTNEKLLSLVRDPYQQVEVREVKCEEAGLYWDPEIIEGLGPLQSISLLVGQGLSFMTRFRYAFNRIQTLSLEISSRQSRTLLEYVSERSKSLNLQNFNVAFNDRADVNMDISDEEGDDGRMMVFPFIEGLLSLSLFNFPGALIPSQYGGLQKLALESCPFFEDVSQFGNIYDLTLTDCKSIKDIRALNNNHTIAISWCDKIENYSHSFENSVNISICTDSYEKRIVFGNLNCVRSLEVDENYDFGLVSEIGEGLTRNVGFDGLMHLFLMGNCNIHSVEGLGSVPVLGLYNLDSLSSLEGLGKGNRKVIISSCKEVTNFTPLRFIDTVEIRNCKGFTNATHIDHVKNVSLEGSLFDPIDLAPLGQHVQQLFLESEINDPSSLAGLENIPVIGLGFDSRKIESIKPVVQKLFAGNHQKIVFRCFPGRWNDSYLNDLQLVKEIPYNRYDLVFEELNGLSIDNRVAFLRK